MKPALTTRAVGGVNWRIRLEYAQALEPILTDLALPVDNPRHTVFKDSPGGTAIFTFKPNRPDLPAELFVKIYRYPDWRSRLERVLRFSPALQKWKMAAAHEQRGLPAALHLARGERRQLGLVTEDIVLQEAPVNYHAFDEYFRTTFRPELPGLLPEHKRLMIRDLARLVRQMHDRGIVRTELEPRNIMAARQPGGGVALMFVDLAQAQEGGDTGPISFSERLESLAHFNETFAPFLNRGYRLRFFREYFAPDQMSPGEFSRRIHRILDRAEQIGRHHVQLARRDVGERRSPYYWFCAGDYRIFLAESVYQNDLMEMFELLPKAAAEHSLLRLKLVGEPRPLEAQVITCPPAPDLARRFLSPARSAFLLAAGLRARRVPHRPVVAAIEARHRAWAKPGWLLFERPETPGTVNLAEYLARKVADEFSGLPWDRTVLPRLARFIIWLQDMGLAHVRASGENIWIRRTPTGAHEFLVGDLHLLRDGLRLSLPAAVQYLTDLFAVLPISETDGWIVVEEYLRYSRRFRDRSEQFRARFRQRAREWKVSPERPA